MKLFELKAEILEEFPDYVIIEDGNIYDMKKCCFVEVHKKKDGYCYVYLRGRKNPEFLHRIIAKAFVLNPDNLPQVDHLNGDRGYNHSSNLHWVTAAQNTAKSRHPFKFEQGARKPKAIKAVIHDKTSFETEICFDLTDDDFGETVIFHSVNEAARIFGIHPATISQNLQGFIKLLSVPYKGETIKIHFEIVPYEERNQKKLF